MSLWDSVKGFHAKNAHKLVYARIPKENADVPPGAPIAANEGYVRIWLSDLFLGKSRAWFSDWYPCASTSVRIDAAGGSATLTHVARPPANAMGPGVRVAYPVTGLLPFSGGTVEIEAALLALKGSSGLDAALSILESFAGLVTGPAAQAIGIAEKIAGGLEKLFGASEGQVHLGLHDTFASAGGNAPLEPGYLAVVLATPAQVDPARLGVGQKRLFVRGPNGAWAPLEGFDYLLLYVEGRAERDDFRLPSIQEPLERALEALVMGDGARADSFRKAALVAALTCKELTPRDRLRVAQAVKQDLDAAKDAGLGLVGEGAADLAAVVAKHAPSIDRAVAGDLPSEDEILS